MVNTCESSGFTSTSNDLARALRGQERDAIAHFEAYVVADSKRDAARAADNDACVWVENGTGELDDRNIEIETLDNLSP